MKNSKLYIGLASGLVVGGLVGSLLIGNVGGDNKVETLATVGGEKITSVDLYDSMKTMYGVSVLDSLVSDKLIELESDKEKIKVTDEEIQKELDVVALQYGSLEQLETALKQSNRSMDELKEDIEMYVTVKKLLEDRVKVTDEEIEKYFEENKATMGQTEQVRASHILVDSEEKAKEVLAKIRGGESFEDVAKEYSTDTANSSTGGDLGYFGRDEMVEAFEKAAFSMEVGELSEPVKSDFGYHIIKVTDKQDAKEATLEDSKEFITENLKEQKMDSEYSVWLEEMKEEYKVKNNLSTATEE